MLVIYTALMFILVEAASDRYAPRNHRVGMRPNLLGVIGVKEIGIKNKVDQRARVPFISRQ